MISQNFRIYEKKLARREILDFTVGQSLKKLKCFFWAENSTNIILEYTKRCGIATFGGGGGMFSKKSSLCLYFHEKIMILDF